MKANIATIIANTIIESKDAAIALGKDDSLLKSFDANHTGIEIIIQAIRKPIITPTISGICIVFSLTIITFNIILST